MIVEVVSLLRLQLLFPESSLRVYTLCRSRVGAYYAVVQAHAFHICFVMRFALQM